MELERVRPAPKGTSIAIGTRAESPQLRFAGRQVLTQGPGVGSSVRHRWASAIHGSLFNPGQRSFPAFVTPTVS